jgi:tetratricopeptide (TPR) repeat protein
VELIAGRFEIERLAGSGGMGSVYRSRDVTSGEPIALKLLNPAPRHEWRFEREAELLAQLEHPGIVRYVAHGRLDDGRLYLALEWLDGMDLAHRLEGKGLTMRESLLLVARAAEALGAAHAIGIVHRDVKPSNVFLVDGDPARPKVLDFGVARVLAASATRTGTTLGTPAYMAPEQASGRRDVDARADVWSLGCLLFECLTGTPPFTGDHPMAILGKIVVARAPRVRELRPEVPLDLDELVSRLLARDREERPKSGNAVAVELRELAEIGVPDRTTRSARRPTLTTTEQRLMGVIMADSWRSQEVDPATAPTLTPLEMDDALKDARTVASSFGGRLEALAADSLLVTFDVAGNAGEQAARAARCALALRTALPTLRFSVSLGVGLLGERQAAGDVIDRAAVLLRSAPASLSVGSPIVLDEAAAGLLDSAFEVELVEGVRLLSDEHDQLDVPRTLLGKPTPCVGRETEIQMLRDVLDECVGDPGSRVVMVSGAQGQGKSRLVGEFVRAARALAVDVWVGRGDPTSAGASYALLARLLTRTLRIYDGEPLATRVAKLQAEVEKVVEPVDAVRVSQFLGELAGVAFPDPDVKLSAARQNPRLMGDQIARAWEDYLAATCQKRPLLLVLEDLHWGDVASLNLMLGAAHNLARQPLMVLLTGRPEVYETFPKLREMTDLAELRLRKLSKKAGSELTREILGKDADEAHVQELVSQADGNPLYLEELIRASSEGKSGSGAESALAMVQSRLEALPADLRRALRACSIFGETFWVEGVRRLVGVERETGENKAWVDELNERELTTKRTTSRYQGLAEYAVRHSLVREAAYRMLTPEDRALGHRLAAEWLSEVGETNPLILAEHWDRGGDKERAIVGFCRATRAALGSGDLARALEYVSRATQMGARGEVLGELELLASEALEWMGDLAAAETRARHAAELLPATSAGHVHASTAAAEYALRRGETESVVQVAERLLHAPESVEEAPEISVSMSRMTAHLHRAGRRDLAEQLALRLARMLTARPGHPLLELALYGAKAWDALFAGDIAESLRYDELAADAAERAGDIRMASKHRMGAGWERMLLGDWNGAVQSLTESLRVAERLAIQQVVLDSCHNLGLALARVGRLDEALEHEQRAVHGFARQKDWRMQGASHSYLAIIHALRNDFDAAEIEATMGAQLMSEAPSTHVAGLGVLAWVRLQAGNAKGALAPALEAMKQLEVAGEVEDGEALARLAHVSVLLANDRVHEAREALKKARERLLTRAERIADLEARQRFLSAVPENERTLALAAEYVS